MTVLLQVSDPHFGTERPRVMQALERLVRLQRPDVLLMTGDITQRARRPEFSAARAFVDRLAVPATLVLPGNHDIPLFNLWARVWDPYARFRHVFGATLEREYDSPQALVLTLNTTRWYRHTDGEISESQIERVARRLASATPAQCRVVAVHQPVAVTRESDQVNLLRGHERAVRRWAQAGADLVVGGHIHLPFVVPLHERWPDLPRRMWAVQAGTALSTRVRAGISNSVNLIRVGADRHIERWDYDESTGEFTEVDATPLNP
ncbi:metallophosphoesterase family protein [Roseateles amylovorans]|uniref:Metallophosphoesterase n=1 Tax=Roseateles amylovorans TaxID=2978473 RepID=A0ABY6B358_9BURK|nr:metallophosphoesterase [Roseateles amylovorans]UXH79828.1 metallophosphoesterase [Roseateles amylovorans]